jgi:dTDP-4-amino-4,6-dideoxygalactose transaminase
LYDFARTFRNVGRESFGHGPIVMLGYNYRMSDIHAAVGLNQLHRIVEFVEKRNRLARHYLDILGPVSWIAPQEVSRHSSCTYYSYIVRLLPGAPVSRDNLAKTLESKGIETTIMFRPLHKQPYFEKFFKPKTNLGNAESVGLNSIALPMHAGLKEDDIDYVAKAIKGA